jgi:U6 snRNA-associated Sm-like protein LSm3
MVLGDVEETVTVQEIDDETYEATVRVRTSLALACSSLSHLPQSTKRKVEFLYVRGDGVILVSPPIRS